ncbi:alpha/beta hydrolase [Oceanospirillum sediminis]|uniref:Alpha/beta hydrolase n=1 Tax=Oceanospirillum sediminis TaxID=2760088 RepID=A0A839IW92_9GAMM|nr:alpha/beta fold hydrolase [Oceanospirillum sediminis]MBB1489635.1 alpha/beta hydrolase [Oceanospirillum sediminis]
MKIFRHLLIGLITGYVVLILIIFSFQRDLLYSPGTTAPSEKRLTEKNLIYWPSMTDYRGFTSTHEPDKVKGTIVVFHGNAATAYHRHYYTDALHQYGFRIILAEYPGYGSRQGSPSETAIVDDALETLQLVYERYQEPVFILGESLGSGVAASTIARTKVPIEGLILLVPWDTLMDLALTHYGYLLLHWLVLDRYDSISNLANFNGRVAVVLAEKDDVIPVRHGLRLYDSINTDKKLWLFKDAGHDTIPVAPDSAWWKEVTDFITQ